MSDLASLMKIAPISAAGMVGQNNAQARQSEALRQQELEAIIANRLQQMQEAQQMQPLKLENQRLTNEGLNAGLGGIAATSDSLRQKADMGKLTFDSDVRAKNSKNDTDVTENNVKKDAALGAKLISMAPELAGVPMGLGQRHGYVSKALGDVFGNEAQKAAFAKMITQIPEDQLPLFLKTVGEEKVKQSEKYIIEMTKEREGNKSKEKIAGGNNATTLEAERMRIAAGKYDRNKTATTVADRLMRAKTPTEKAEILETAFYEADAAGDDKAAKLYADRAVEARQRAAEDYRNRGLATPRPDVEATTKGRVPNTPAPAATAPIAARGAAAAAPAAPVLGESTGGIAAKLKAEGMDYEPNKYDYRIGPNGKVQRKPKG